VPKQKKLTLFRKQFIGLNVTQASGRGSNPGTFKAVWECQYIASDGKTTTSVSKVELGPPLEVTGPMFRAFQEMYKHYASLAVAPGVLAKPIEGGHCEVDPRWYASVGHKSGDPVKMQDEYMAVTYFSDPNATLKFGTIWEYKQP